MTANEKLKRVLVLVGGGFILGCLMFPPWVYTGYGTETHSRSEFAGYQCILFPEKEAAFELWAVHIDLPRLVIQCAAICLVLWVVYYLGKRPEGPPPK